MAIADRNLSAGTALVARYKGETHRAKVVETEVGLRYRLEDGREFKSPSSAGSAVMGGKSCNGWAFWSLASEAKESPEAAEASKPVTKPRAAPKGMKKAAVKTA